MQGFATLPDLAVNYVRFVLVARRLQHGADRGLSAVTGSVATGPTALAAEPDATSLDAARNA